MGVEAFKVQNVLNVGSLQEAGMLSCVPLPWTAPARTWKRLSCCRKGLCGEGARLPSRIPGTAAGVLVLADGLFFGAMGYNLSRVWPLVGLALDELLINCDTGCCL